MEERICERDELRSWHLFHLAFAQCDSCLYLVLCISSGACQIGDDAAVLSVCFHYISQFLVEICATTEFVVKLSEAESEHHTDDTRHK